MATRPGGVPDRTVNTADGGGTVGGGSATEGTLVQVRDAVEALDGELRAADLEVRDDEAQALLAAIRDALDAPTGTDTALTVLQAIRTAVDALPIRQALTDEELRALEVDVNDDAAQALLQTIADTVAALPTGQALTDTQLRALDVDVNDDAAHALLQNIVDAINASGGTRTLAERMLAKAPAEGYTLWFDTADPSHLYVLEAPSGAAASATTFRGVRITMLAGAPVGPVEVNPGGTLSFDGRTSDAGWSA